MPWVVPRLWPNDRCYILGGGPSLPVSSLECLRDKRTIAVNNAYKVAPWADALFFGDCQWLKRYGQGLDHFAGLKVTSCASWERERTIRVLRKELMPYGISTDPQTLRWNLSSGACAINLAYHFGVSEIVLLGFDMHKGPNGENNFHADYGHPAGRNPYPRFLLPFLAIKADLDRLGVRVLNATPGSSLTLWPIVDPAEVGISGGRAPGQDPQGAVDAAQGCDSEEVPGRILGARETNAPGAISSPEARGVRGRLAPDPTPARGRVPRGTKILGVRDSARVVRVEP